LGPPTRPESRAGRTRPTSFVETSTVLGTDAANPRGSKREPLPKDLAMRAQGRGEGPLTRHHEAHRTGRTAWLRAAVLGADALVSTASLMIGVAASSASKEAILVAGAWRAERARDEGRAAAQRARSARRTHAGRARRRPGIPRAPHASGVGIGRELFASFAVVPILPPFSSRQPPHASPRSPR